MKHHSVAILIPEVGSTLGIRMHQLINDNYLAIGLYDMGQRPTRFIANIFVTVLNDGESEKYQDGT